MADWTLLSLTAASWVWVNMWRITLYRSTYEGREELFTIIYINTLWPFSKKKAIKLLVDVLYSMLVMVNVGVPRFTSKHNVCMTFKPLPPRGPKNHGIPWLLTQRDLNTILGSDISFWDKSTYFEAQWSLLRKKTISGSWGRPHSYLELFYSLVMVACPQL